MATKAKKRVLRPRSSTWKPSHEAAVAESIGSSILAGPGLNACGMIADDCLGCCLKATFDVTTDARGSIYLSFIPDLDFFRKTPTESIVTDPLEFDVSTTGWNAHPMMETLRASSGLARITSMTVRYVPTEPLVDRGGRVAVIVAPAVSTDAVAQSSRLDYPGAQAVLYANEIPFSTTQQRPLWALEDASEELFVVGPPMQPEELHFATFGNSVFDTDEPILTRPDEYNRMAPQTCVTLAFAGCTASTTIGFVEVCLCSQLVVGSSPGISGPNAEDITVLSLINTPEPPHPAIGRALVDSTSTVIEELKHTGQLAFRSIDAAHRYVGKLAKTAVSESFGALGGIAKKYAPMALGYALRYAATSLGRSPPPALAASGTKLLRSSPLIEEVF